MVKSLKEEIISEAPKVKAMCFSPIYDAGAGGGFQTIIGFLNSCCVYLNWSTELIFSCPIFAHEKEPTESSTSDFDGIIKSISITKPNMFQTELPITLKNPLLLCSFITFSKKQSQLPVTGKSCEKAGGFPYYLEWKECRYRKSKAHG